MQKKDNDMAHPELAQRQNIGRLLLRASRDFSGSVCSRLKARGHARLAMAHVALIVNLDADGTRATTLAERADMTKQATGQLVKELEQTGYLERRPDASDRRAQQVRLTNAGQQLLRDVHQAVEEAEADCRARLGEPRLQMLQSILADLVAPRAKPGN